MGRRKKIIIQDIPPELQIDEFEEAIKREEDKLVGMDEEKKKAIMDNLKQYYDAKRKQRNEKTEL